MMTTENTEVVDTTSDETSDEDAGKKKDHLVKAIAQRDKYKSQSKDQLGMIKDLQGQLKKMTKTRQIEENDKDAMLVSADEMVKELTAQVETVTLENTQMKQAQVREGVISDILTTVNTSHTVKAELMLEGLSGRGLVSLLPDEDDREVEVEKARTLLQKLDPALFASDGARAPGVPGNLPGTTTPPAKEPSNGARTTPMHIGERLRLRQQNE